MSQENSAHSAICEVCGDHFVPDGRRKRRCSKTHERSCSQCGETFVITANAKVDQEFCSRKCSAQSRSVDKSQVCPICGNFFVKISKTCSMECSVELRRRTKESAPLTRSCSHCGKDFQTTNGAAQYCDGVHTNECEVCGTHFEVTAGSTMKSCSRECRGKLVNSEKAKEKKRIKSRERFGTDSPFQAEEIKEKIRSANLEKYGHESHLAAPEIRKKIEATNLERYGATYFNGSEEGRKRLKQRSFEKFGVGNPFQSEEVKQKTIRAKALESFRANINSGTVHHQRVSKINRKFAQAIESQLGLSVEFEATYGNYFADLRVWDDSKEMLIEINPTVSHNSQKAFGCLIGGCGEGCEDHLPLEKSYHQKRGLAAMAENHKLLQWYDWNGGPEELVKLLRSKFMPARKLSARKLELRSISSKMANLFLRDCHIQGEGRQQSHCYGLFESDELIAVATFGKSRFGAKADFEFLRYAVAPGYVIHGGSGRLIQRFLNDVADRAMRLISYVDLDHTTAPQTFLHSAGFEECPVGSPGLIWHNLSTGKAVRNTSLLAQGADRLLGTSYGPRDKCGLGNDEIMLLEGFLPVHTSGNRVFLKQ